MTQKGKSYDESDDFSGMIKKKKNHSQLGYANSYAQCIF